MDGKIYLDNAASTPILAEVYREMLDSYTSNFAETTSIHSFGVEADCALEKSREKIAKAIGAKSSEIYFTSSASESNNWAILGIARANKNKGKHIIVSEIEHRSILSAVDALKEEGFEVSYVPVDENGIICYSELVKLIRKDTILISIMSANDLVGSIQPVHAISMLAKMNGIIFHTDASLAISEIELNVDELNIGSMTISSNKIHGPKGISALYVKKGVKIQNLIYGGENEKSLRGGSISVPLAIGFAKAIELSIKNMNRDIKFKKKLRKFLYSKIKERIPNAHLIGHPRQRLSGNLNIAFEGVNGEAVAVLLDKGGIAVSATSSCEASSDYPSHVLKAMHLDNSKMYSSVRFSLSILNTEDEIEKTINVLAKAVKKLRSVSPVRVYNMRGGN